MLMSFRIALLAFALGAPAGAEELAITGGTLVDVSHFGHNTHDIPDAVVLIDGGKIVAAGPASNVHVPDGARRIEARGRFIVPGLIDGFGAFRDASFGDAYLDEGVTTVYVPTVLPVGGGDGETKLARAHAPGPDVLLGAPLTGYSETGADPSDGPMRNHRLHDRRLTNGELIARIDRLTHQGYRGITISYDVWPDQIDAIVAEAKRQHLAILAEPAFTTYPYAIFSGVEALPHDDHYNLALAPAQAWLARSDDISRGRPAFRAVCATPVNAAAVADLGRQLAGSQTALLPTLAVEATADALNVDSPWHAPVARFIDPKDLDNPVDRATGASAWLASLPAAQRTPVRACAWHKEALDARLHRLGAKFLAGSAATTYGVMPGSGLHVELGLLRRIGLSPREALAAATSNFADIYGWRDVGRIEPGRIANIVILSSDPRTSTAALDHIATVILHGTAVRGARV